MTPPRLRFSPAPTGYLHLGSARSALFNWIYARHAGGTFVLRIEDTDPERSREDLVEGILSSLRWLGVDWDEGPVRQSQRAELYAVAARRLLDEGRAYYCDCTPDALKARIAPGSPPGYDGFCRDRGLGPGDGRALRFRTPDDGDTVVHDLIRGEVSFAHSTLEDFVIVRATGAAMFILANAVDDADMGITHVVRGEDLLPSTPRALLLRRALGGDDALVFAHLPLLVNEKRQKLSKRRDDVALEDYRNRGYLPEAMANYLATLGWGPPDGVEIRPMKEIVELFRLDDVTRAPAFFDHKKLDHFNGEYIRALPVATFVRHALPWLQVDAPWLPERYDPDAFERLAPLVQERVTTMAEVPSWVDFLFLDEPVIDEASWAKTMEKAPVGAFLDDVMLAYGDCDWTAGVLHDVTFEVGERHGLGKRNAQAPVRVAVTGRTVGPPLFESLEVLGRELTLARVRDARARI